VPPAPRFDAEAPADAVVERCYLAAAIRVGQRGENRLGIAAAEHLRLPAVHHPGKPPHVFWKFLAEELHQPTADVHGERKLGMSLEHLEERPVAAIARVGRRGEVPRWLMGVHAEVQFDRVVHGSHGSIEHGGLAHGPPWTGAPCRRR
jgi:hypothetical protein